MNSKTILYIVITSICIACVLAVYDYASNNDHSFALIPGLLSSHLKGKFDYRREYSPQLRQIYSQYLGDNPFLVNCSQQNGKALDIGAAEMDSALVVAEQQIAAYVSKFTESTLQAYSKYMYNLMIRSKYNEYVSLYLSQIKCLNKEQSSLKLKTIAAPDAVKNNGLLCDADAVVSDVVACDPSAKYSRLDGKCNNFVHTNWGSNFTSFRSLLAPDYGNGINTVRVARDGAALVRVRDMSKALIPQIDVFDDRRTGMHMMWGQLIAHDTFKYVQFLSGGLACCLTHDEECAFYDPLTPEPLSIAFNQTCMNQVRGVASDACRLGARAHVNAATHTQDLSNLYGGNNNNSETLREYSKGLLHMVTSLDKKSDVLGPMLLRNETFEGPVCVPPATRPYLTCFETGDGIRGNQQPLIQALTVMMARRHNQHAQALSIVNRHWDDERLYHEARRLLIAEYQYINYKEYVPATLGADIRRYFDLDVKTGAEFTHYDRNVNPNSITEVGVGPFRFAHSQIAKIFHAIHKLHYKSYGFFLRNKYFEPSDVNDGNAAAIIRGLTNDPAMAFDRFSVPDVQDYVQFFPMTPTINDLHALDVVRGREFGVPSYAYHAQFCTGVSVNSWTDLATYIPEQFIRQLKALYTDYRDVDLMIGGLYERPKNGSLMGPVFECLNGLQFYHWKYGDRFYVEHRDQAGSFTEEQLINIRETSSLANIICKTTDTNAMQANVMLRTSEANPLIHCDRYEEFDYNLWKEL